MTGQHKRTVLQRLNTRKTDVAVWLLGASLLFLGCVKIASWWAVVVAAGLALMSVAEDKRPYRWQRKP